jgi:thiamine kinase-like enzyme
LNQSEVVENKQDSERVMPLTEDDLSCDWLNQVLAEHLNNNIIASFESSIIGVGEGFMGQLARLTLHYEESISPAPKTLIAKFASPNERTREMAREQKYYEREIGFYNDIGQEVGIPTAECLYTQLLKTSNHFVIILKDLAPAIASDQVAGTAAEDSKWVVEVASKLHANWWNSERLKAYSWSQPITSNMPIEDGLIMLQASIKKAEANGKFDDYPEIKRLMKFLPPLFIMEPGPPFPFTLTHGDLRSDNVFCPSDAGGNYALIDWQLCGMGQPAGDLARWFTQSITIEQRRSTEKDLLKYYHECLVSHGVKDYSYKKLIQDYQLNLVIILLMFSMSTDDIDQSPERAQALFHAMYSRLDAALVDWKVIKLLKVLPYLIPFIKLSTWFKSKFSK